MGVIGPNLFPSLMVTLQFLCGPQYSWGLRPQGRQIFLCQDKTLEHGKTVTGNMYAQKMKNPRNLRDAKQLEARSVRESPAL